MRHILWALTCALSLAAQGAEIALPRAGSTIVLDGDLSDEAWQSAARIDTFYEYLRSDNGAPPVPTVAFLMYDDRYLYIGVDCKDPDPSKIRAPYVDRDQVFGDMDNVGILIDARGEGKVGLQLRSNARGIQADAVNNDSSGTEDFSPDFFYDTAAQIHDGGWSVEFRIPLSTLRYTDAEPQTWGIIVIRNWPRDFRYVMASNPLPRGSNCFVCHQTKLTGITGLPSPQHLIAAPYVSSQISERAPANDRNFDGDIGLDLKWSPTPDTAVDATLNPDFSQIESDVAQIAANERFALFYPEKRPFFLERSDLLQTKIDAVYTRTITSPRWGARGTGKHAGTSWTLLLSDDRGGGLLILPGPLGSSFALQNEESLNLIGRARREIGPSFIGVLLTARESEGEGGHNRVFGPDFEWRPNETDVVNGQLLVSDTSDRFTDGTSHALELEYNHTKERYDFGIGVEDFGDEFRADNGFVPQVGHRELEAGGGYNFYPQDSWWVQIRPNAGFTYTTDRDGETILQDQNLGAVLRGKRNLFAQASLHVAKVSTGEDLIRQTFVRYFVAFNPSARWPNFGLGGRFGEDVDFGSSRPARSFVANFSSTFRPTPRLQAEVNWSHEQLDTRDVPDAGRLYTASVQRLKLTYSFTSKSLLRVIGQYVRTEFEQERYEEEVPLYAGSSLASVLYSYKLNWQTVLFVGYGDDRLLDPMNANLHRAGRTLFAKISYAIQR